MEKVTLIEINAELDGININVPSVRPEIGPDLIINVDAICEKVKQALYAIANERSKAGLRVTLV